VTTVVDLHSDLLRDLAHRGSQGDASGEESWLDLLDAGGVSLQVCAINVASPSAASGLDGAIAQAGLFHRLVRRHERRVAVLRRGDEIEPARRAGRIGLVLALEGAECLEHEPIALEALHELGLRVLGLTWYGDNAFADGNSAARPGRGLSARGRELVAHAVELGLALDLAHASDRTFGDVLESLPSDHPVLLSHAGCRALFDDHRNVSDDQLRAVAARGGVVGLFAIPAFLHREDTSLDPLLRHLEHALAVAGEEHVALGGDFVGPLLASGAMPPRTIRLGTGGEGGLVDGLGDPAGYPAFVAALRSRGVPEALVARICHENATAFLERALA
jgi:membrane dipeptidase